MNLRTITAATLTPESNSVCQSRTDDAWTALQEKQWRTKNAANKPAIHATNEPVKSGKTEAKNTMTIFRSLLFQNNDIIPGTRFQQIWSSTCLLLTRPVSGKHTD